MFINIPIELQENIYQRLDAKDRIKMRLALPKNSSLYNRDRDKGLVVASNYIKKNRTKILEKKKYIKPQLLDYLKKHKADVMVKQYCADLILTTISHQQNWIY